MARSRQQFLSLFVLLTATLSISSAERVRFDNYPMYKLTADTEVKLALLRSVEDSSDSVIFLNDVMMIGQGVQVTVAPHKVPDFLQALSLNDIAYDLVEPNFQKVLDKMDRQAELTARKRHLYNWEEYQQLGATYLWMRSLAEKYPNAVTLLDIGSSFERRSILGIKISMPNKKTKKPGIFVEAGIHAREWIAPATATHIIHQLLTSDDPEIKRVAQNYDWYIFPHVNPDGYVYTHTTNRLWRKTRSSQPCGCFGTDANRNFDINWNKVGASNNSCDNKYAGPTAFSEIETRALSQYITSLKGKINLYIALHSYSQFLLYPYGAFAHLPENHNDLRQVFNATVAAISKRYGTKYTGGNIYSAVYPAAGASTDWVYTNADIKMVFCFELRPLYSPDSKRFELPAQEIIPTGRETLDGIIAMIYEASKLGYFS